MCFINTINNIIVSEQRKFVRLIKIEIIKYKKLYKNKGDLKNEN